MIYEFLSDGREVSVAEINKEAMERGISERTVRLARNSMKDKLKNERRKTRQRLVDLAETAGRNGKLPIVKNVCRFATSLFKYRRFKNMKEVPIWEKTNLTLEEAAAYSGIGINKLRENSWINSPSSVIPFNRK